MVDFTDCPVNPYRIYGGPNGKKIDKGYVQCLMERIDRIQSGEGKIEEHELIEVADYLEEDEDRRIAEEAYQEYLDSGCKSTPIEEFWKELDDEV